MTIYMRNAFQHYFEVYHNASRCLRHTFQPVHGLAYSIRSCQPLPTPTPGNYNLLSMTICERNAFQRYLEVYHNASGYLRHAFQPVHGLTYSIGSCQRFHLERLKVENIASCGMECNGKEGL